MRCIICPYSSSPWDISIVKAWRTKLKKGVQQIPLKRNGKPEGLGTSRIDFPPFFWPPILSNLCIEPQVLLLSFLAYLLVASSLFVTQLQCSPFPVLPVTSLLHNAVLNPEAASL